MARRGSALDRRGARRKRLWWLLGAAAVVGVVCLGTALRLGRAAADLKKAKDLVDAAAVAIEDGRLADARAGLASAQGLVSAANHQLYGRPELEIVGVVPGIHQNLESLRESVGLSTLLVDGGRRILQAAKPLEGPDGKLEVPLADGAIPLDAVVASQREVDALASALPGRSEVDDRPPFLVGPVGTLRDRVAAEATRRRAQLDVLDRGLGLLADMAGARGDRRYLVAVANTAEMRGSGGMVLSYGILNGKDGDFELGDFGRIDELDLDAPVDASTAGLPADYLARWNGFDVTERWRNATMSADFTLVAPVLEQMGEQATGLPLDGVIQIDPQGLAAILEGTGPVQVPGVGEVSAATVVPLTLNEAYQRFPGIEQRSDVLGDIAEAAFTKLFDGEYDSLRPLATAIVKTVAGRHILFHAKSPTIESQSRFFNADGGLPPADLADHVALTIQNVSANKLDYYLDSSLQLTGSRPQGKAGQLQATITLTNTAPPGASSPTYIFGPFNADQQAGLYRGVVSLYLPVGTSVQGSSGDAPSSGPTTQSEDGRAVATFTIDVPAGQSRTVVLDLRLAPRQGGGYGLVVVPSPRVKPTHLRADIASEAGKAQGEVELDRVWRLAPSRAPRPVG